MTLRRAAGCAALREGTIPSIVRTILAAITLLLSTGAAIAQTQGPSPARSVRALVTLEDARGVRAMGVVVAGSGRILTALDPIHDATALRVVYPDGRRDRARVVAINSPWGIALLEGEAGSWPEGVELSPRDARTRDAVVWYTSAAGEASQGTLIRRRSFVSGSASLLRDAWELSPTPANVAVGGALFHAQDGSVLGVIVPPGANEITGAEFSFGVPLPVVRELVERAGASSRPWVGITFAEVLGGQADVAAPSGGLRVRSLDPDGPGARAGLRSGANGDLVVAVDGQPVHSISAFGEHIAPLRAGDTITLQVHRRGALTDVPLTLAERPREHPTTPSPRAEPAGAPRRAPRRP